MTLSRRQLLVSSVALAVLLGISLMIRPAPSRAQGTAESRKPKTDDELRSWLQNMVWHHGFSHGEIAAATGLTNSEIDAALEKFGITRVNKPRRSADSPLLVLPYPGGRHPRQGFLEGAVAPQRETKVSVFTPWDEASYVVADVPEAIWSHLGLLYLAHTHVPTIWTKQGVTLDRLEWNRRSDGTLDSERRLPNGVTFGTKIVPTARAVRMEMWLTNGSKERLTDLRVQNCVLLKHAKGFEQQTKENKIFSPPYAACRSSDGRRWVITAWEPNHRAWANPPCPCIHSDPKFPDCDPGQTVRLRGWLSFYEGTDIEAEFRRIDQTGWRTERPAEARTTRLHGEVVDAATAQPIPCRLYLQAADGTWFFPQSSSPQGSAVPYRKQRPNQSLITEMHTTLSAHPFVVELPPGSYTLTVERGKEYWPSTEKLTVGTEPIRHKVSLRRWINMHERGWFSGDTHVHRELEELPNLLLAEDLNVAFPLQYWVRDAFVSPKGSKPAASFPREPRPISVDAAHVFYPLNTEYEIFTVGKKPHTLGAFFVLNQQSVLEDGVPPVQPIARRAHQEGGLIEMDKHNWPWSIMLVPVMPVDLYELSNNHVWRTSFGFPAFGEAAADYMKVEKTARGWTEWGWLDFGFQTYYGLLNCGFRLRPTAGTASGVHPVPLGFGRVYVHLPEGFTYEGWVRGLRAGRSFVTTGPMLELRLNEQEPGHTFQQQGNQPTEYRLQGSVTSGGPLQRIEVIVNGEIIRTVKPDNHKDERGAYQSRLEEKLRIDSSSWIAVRGFERTAEERIRFAHSSPFFVDVADKPLRPRKEEVTYFIQRVQEQLTRNADMLPPAALQEYREALSKYQELVRTAR